MSDQGSDMRELGGFGFKKFLAGWNIEEEITDGDASSRRQARFFHFEDLSAVNFNDSSRGLVGSTGFQPQTRNRSDGREGFAAKAQSGYTEQIFSVPDFGGGVTLEGQQSIVAHHAAAVIGDLDELFSASLNLNANAGCTGSSVSEAILLR